MSSENNPTVAIDWWNGTSWESLKAYAAKFTIRDAGVLRIPSFDLRLKNKAGRFTSGSTKIAGVAPIRVTADVRGVVDTIFAGFYLGYTGDYTTSHWLDVHAKGYAVKLLWDTITKAYREEWENGVAWTTKTVIDNFLLTPDSGVDTGIVLSTDSGIITTQEPIEDLTKEPLLDALRKICEKINYDGYMASETSLVLKSVGSVAANPAITLAHPFIYVKPRRDWEEIKNFLLPWGDVEAGIPPTMDRWTQDWQRWTGLWVPDFGCTMVNSSEQALKGVSLKLTNSAGIKASADLDITKDPVYSLINASTGRFAQFSVGLYPTGFGGDDIYPTVYLQDDATPINNMIAYGSHDTSLGYKLLTAGWTIIKALVGPSTVIKSTTAEGCEANTWWYYAGTTFNWRIKRARIRVGNSTQVGSCYVDLLYFIGGKKIDPLANAAMYPTCPVKDDSSIASYKRRVAHPQNSALKSFEQATLSAQRDLAVLKDPIQKVEVKKGAKTWAKPHETLTLTIPEYEISGTWRILEQIFEWSAGSNNLRSTFILVPQTTYVSSQAIQADQISGILRGLK